MEIRESVARSTVLVTAVTGIGSLLAFLVFLYRGALDVVDLGLGDMGRLLFDTLLSAAFFLQHSLMIRKPLRRRLEGVIPSPYQGALYTVASGLVLLGCIACWQGSDILLLEAQGPARGLMRAASFLSLLGFAWGIRALGDVDMLGLAPLRRNLRGKQPLPPKRFIVRGPYRWVRHPLYLFTIVLFWSNPVLTLDRLLFNILWTTWVIIGAVFEERDLVADFGDAYRDYQKNVPMFIPRIA
ncbi:MAG: methyltransferase family protein [Syntrophales bacterium]